MFKNEEKRQKKRKRESCRNSENGKYIKKKLNKLEADRKKGEARGKYEE
jgi:hypothetical protein